MRATSSPRRAVLLPRRARPPREASAVDPNETRLACALEAIAAGDEEALSVVLEILGARARYHLAPFGLDTDEVDDALQATYIELHRSAARFDPARGTAYTWCFTILRRRALDLVRRRRPSVNLADIELGEQPIDDVDARLDLEGAMAQLPVDIRRTTMLWVSGLARDEIAWVTGRDRQETAASLRRAQRSLRALESQLR